VSYQPRSPPSTQLAVWKREVNENTLYLVEDLKVEVGGPFPANTRDSSTYWAVEAHQGTISVASEHGQGTTFKIILPVDGILTT